MLIVLLRLGALERGVVLGGATRDLGKLKTWTQSIAAILGGFAAGGSIDDSIAGGLLVALVVTWVSGLDYARLAPRLLRSRVPA